MRAPTSTAVPLLCSCLGELHRGRTGAASARDALEQLPAAQVCITRRYVKASAQDVGAEGECA